MKIQLAKPIAAYFQAANIHDSTRLADCFAERAVVYDEGHEYHGLDAIKLWNEETSKNYALALEVISVAQEAGQTLVAARASGNFAGSPAIIHFNFTVEDEKVICLRCE